VTCPWGNRFFVYPTAPDGALPPLEKRRRTASEEANLLLDRGMAVRGEAGIRFVQWRCADAGRVARFYEDTLGCCVQRRADGADMAVCVGPSVHLIFTTTPGPRDAEQLQLAKGIHVCVYTCDFKRTYEALKDRGLIWTNPRFTWLDTCDSFEEAVASRQFRFKSLRDASGEELAELEHEVRSLRHVQFMKQVSYVPR